VSFVVCMLAKFFVNKIFGISATAVDKIFDVITCAKKVGLPGLITIDFVFW
jgi:hypothetical protein